MWPSQTSGRSRNEGASEVSWTAPAKSLWLVHTVRTSRISVNSFSFIISEWVDYGTHLVMSKNGAARKKMFRPQCKNLRRAAGMRIGGIPVKLLGPKLLEVAQAEDREDVCTTRHNELPQTCLDSQAWDSDARARHDVRTLSPACSDTH